MCDPRQYLARHNAERNHECSLLEALSALDHGGKMLVTLRVRTTVGHSVPLAFDSLPFAAWFLRSR